MNNRNGITSGRCSYLSTGRLPRGASYISRMVNLLRRALEDATQATHGEVSVQRAALIVSACRHEARALLTQRLLRNADDDLPVMDTRHLLADFTQASDARDRCILALELTGQPDPMAAYLRQQQIGGAG